MGGVDRKAELEALWKRLAVLVAGAEGQAAAALSRELRAVMVELSELSAKGAVSIVDELGGRRDRRQSEKRVASVGSRRGKRAK